MVFVDSMGDLFHENVPNAFILQVFEIMKQCPQHTFQILTKRPERVLRWFNTEWFFEDVLPNLWIGVSVEDQKAAEERIPLLLQTSATVRFVSCEPLLDELHLENYFTRVFNGGGKFRGVDWVIAGCESGAKRRLAEVDWFRSLRDQCQKADIPFFMKQMEVDGKVRKLPLLESRRWMEFPKTQ
jgi:protein gp37